MEAVSIRVLVQRRYYNITAASVRRLSLQNIRTDCVQALPRSVSHSIRGIPGEIRSEKAMSLCDFCSPPCVVVRWSSLLTLARLEASFTDRRTTTSFSRLCNRGRRNFSPNCCLAITWYVRYIRAPCSYSRRELTNTRLFTGALDADSPLQNLQQNPRTLLPKFFGLYCLQVSACYESPRLKHRVGPADAK